MFHEKFFDLELFLNDLCNIPDPKTFNINHVFQVEKESSHIGYHQEFHGKSKYKQNYNMNNYYSDENSKICFRKHFRYLKQIEKPKVMV